MKQNTRILCGAMAAAMTVSLAGCASNAASSTTAESTAASSSVAAASATAAAAGATYTGTVTAVSANALTLTTESDGEVTVPLVDATTYTRGSMGGQAPDGNPPEMPGNSGDSGDQAGGTPQGSAPGGETEALTYESIAVGDTVTVIVGDDGNASSVELAGSPGGAPGGGSSKPESYDAATEFTADDVRDGVTYASTGTDENSIHVYDGADVTLTNAAISRDSADSTGGDNSSSYGVGAAALVTDGTLYAWDLNVDTSGESSAAIRSDRGSGTMVVDGGSYTSNGTGSPAIYSTADITVNHATLTANGSEAICIEGLNTIRLFGCDLTGNMPTNAQNDCDWNVILYQSMSGDSEQGNATFEMVGGSLTAKNGGMFYTTNTESTFLLDGVDITPADENDFFLKCTGNANARGWGQSGANGADCNFTARNQTMEGDVVWDSISQLDFYILDGSTLTGAVRDDEFNAGNGGDGYANLYISADSKWIVTGDSTLSALACEGTVVDDQGRAVTIKDNSGNVLVQGTSEYTVTVEDYSTTVDAANASVSATFSEYEVDKI